jgi:hypothetical protein
MSLPIHRVGLGAFLTSVLLLHPLIAAERPAVEPNKPEVEVKDKAAALQPGMTAAQVRELLGPPKRIAREILYARYVEQWTYDNPAVRIEFEWRKGKEKQIQTVQTLTAPPR